LRDCSNHNHVHVCCMVWARDFLLWTATRGHADALLYLASSLSLLSPTLAKVVLRASGCDWPELITTGCCWPSLAVAGHNCWRATNLHLACKHAHQLSCTRSKKRSTTNAAGEGCLHSRHLVRRISLNHGDRHGWLELLKPVSHAAAHSAAAHHHHICNPLPKHVGESLPPRPAFID
jgi:hypothetical protein